MVRNILLGIIALTVLVFVSLNIMDRMEAKRIAAENQQKREMIDKKYKEDSKKAVDSFNDRWKIQKK